jgi:hypothetical protein
VLIFQLPHQHHLDSSDKASINNSLLNDFTYLSDHVQIELYLKCSITDETKTKLDEKRWKNIKTYKWTDTSKELLIEDHFLKVFTQSEIFLF